MKTSNDYLSNNNPIFIDFLREIQKRYPFRNIDLYKKLNNKSPKRFIHTIDKNQWCGTLVYFYYDPSTNFTTITHENEIVNNAKINFTKCIHVLLTITNSSDETYNLKIQKRLLAILKKQIEEKCNITFVLDEISLTKIVGSNYSSFKKIKNILDINLHQRTLYQYHYTPNSLSKEPLW